MRKGLRQDSAKRHANRYRRRPVVETQADILFFAVEIPQTLSDVGESAGAGCDGARKGGEMRWLLSRAP